MATITSGSLQRMQARQLAFPNQRIFADEAEEMAWLTGRRRTG
jgi:hypothetical protein